MTPKIWLDVDGVLCDLAGAVVRMYNTLTGQKISTEDIKNWDFSPGITLSEVPSIIFKAKDFWRDHCGEYKDANDFASNILSVNRNLVIATNHHRYGFDDKLNWIERYFLWVKHNSTGIVISYDKKCLFRKGDIVIDDSPSILNFAKDIGAIPICIDRPWNQATSSPSWDGERYDYKSAIEKIKGIL